MTSRRAQKRDGTRKGRQGDEYLREYVMREYEAVREAWLADRSPFRPVHPPLPPVVFTAPELTASELHEILETERAGSVADGNSNTPRGAVVESGVQPDAGEVDAEFESRPGPLLISRPELHAEGSRR